MKSTLEELEVLMEFHEAGEGSEEDIDTQYQAVVDGIEELEFKNMLSNITRYNERMENGEWRMEKTMDCRMD